MKKILFPTDFSNTAENAFIYALQIAQKMKAEILTLHVYQLPAINDINLPNTLREIYESIDLEEFENYKDSIPHLRKIAADNNLDQVEVEHLMIQGETVPSILKIAKKEAVDMIVVGTTGATGLKEIFLGTVAADVLEKASCPVLTVPVEARFDGKLDKIAVTTSFKEEEKRAIQKILGFAKPFDAEVYCINIDTNHTEFYKQQMKQLEADFWPIKNIHFKVLEGTDIETEVANFMWKEAIDMLVMVTHKRNFWQKLFRYSHTKSMAYHLKRPLMAFHAHVLKTA